MIDYPGSLVPADHVEPVPRRIRATLGGRDVLDTTRASYVWEWQAYPQYYIPLDDVDDSLLLDEGTEEHHDRGTARLYGLKVGTLYRPGAAKVYVKSPLRALTNKVRFAWDALDSWFEEDEEVFVHPRSPYSRVDALRSTRRVQVSLEGVVLAESASTVMLFETGLPTRYYFNQTEVDFDHLTPSDTRTACPYKGRTTAYWSARVGSTTRHDLAWSYDFPTGALLPIAGLVAFYNEKVDLTIDGEPIARPRTHFFD